MIGGTDLDNDQFLCHGGEACGGYPTLDDLLPVDISDDVDDLDFDTSYRAQLGVTFLGGASTAPVLGLQIPAQLTR